MINKCFVGRGVSNNNCPRPTGETRGQKTITRRRENGHSSFKSHSVECSRCSDGDDDAEAEADDDDDDDDDDADDADDDDDDDADGAASSEEKRRPTAVVIAAANAHGCRRDGAGSSSDAPLRMEEEDGIILLCQRVL